MNGFSVPIHLKDLELGGGKYVVDGDKAAAGAPKDAPGQRAEVERIRAELETTGAPAVVAEFDTLYVLTRDAEALDAQARSALAQVLCETALGVASASEALKPGASLSAEELDEGRRAFVMAAVLAQAIVEKCDAVSLREKTLKDKKRKDAWSAGRLSCLEGLSNALRGVDVAWLWNLRVVDEACLLLWVRAGARALPNSRGAAHAAERAAAHACIVEAIGTAPAEFGVAAAAALVEDLVLRDEAGAKDAADLCAAGGGGRVAGDLLRELDRVSGESGDASAKLVAAFIDHLGSRAPTAAAPHVAALKTQLSSTHYGLRSAVVSALSAVVCADAQDRREQKEKPLLADDARGALLDLVVERCRDASHWTRAATMRACIKLVEQRAVPRDRYADVASAACGRLKDKTGQVRKNALDLVVAVLAHNPFAPILDPAPYELRADALQAANVADHASIVLRDRARAEAVLAREEDDSVVLEEVDEAKEDALQDERDKRRIELDYHVEVLRLVHTVEASAGIVDRLARSATASDAVGAARVFGACRAFELPSGKNGLRAVLRLACSNHDAVKAEAAKVVAASLDVAAAETGSASQRDQAALQAAKRACALIKGCGAVDLQCLEALIAAAETSATAKKKDNDMARVATPKLVRALWDVAASSSADPATRTAACRFLATCCAAVGGKVVDAPALADACTHVLREVAATDAAALETDAAVPTTFRVDCALAEALGRLVRDSSRTASEARKAELAPTCALLRAALFDHASTCGHWYGACDAVLAATFTLEGDPEACVSEALRSLADKAQLLSDAPEAKAGCLAKTLHAAGGAALLGLVAVEELGVTLKKASTVVEKKTIVEGDDDDLAAAAGDNNEGAEAERDARLLRLVEERIVGSKAEGFVAALAPVAAKIASRALARRGAVPGVLHRAAVLFLAKVSCVSRGVCEEYLPLLITTLAKAPDALARQNVAVALGDLASRQPNSVEPWTDHVYGALRDADATVRAAVLATLAHLALNDMIKARGGGVAEVALLVVDADDTIRRRARAFFEELHKKSTAHSSPIYNLLPDVVSRLSAARRGPVTPVVVDAMVEAEPSSPKKTLRFSVAPSPVQADAAKKLRFSVAPSPVQRKRISILEERDETLSSVDFQSIMGFLLAFVDKEKHAEALAEKLCQRLDATKADDDGAVAKARKHTGDVDAQTASRRDLAYCLGKLLLTEKVCRKLSESIGLYKDALPDAGVYTAFTAIAQKARKLPKGAEALKECLDDWEAKLLAGHERRLDLDGAGPSAPPPSAKKKKKKKKAPAKKRAAARKKKVQSDSEDDDDDGGALAENVAPRASTRPRRGRA